MSSFSDNLKFFIEKRGFNTVTLGEAMNMSAGSIGFYQKGSRFPKNPETIEKLMDILDITAADLFGNREENREKITIEELKTNFDNYRDHIPTTTLPQTLKKVPFNHGDPTTNKIVMENNMQNAEYIYIDKLMLSREYQEAELKAVVMIGSAMEPYLHQGDVAIYSPTTHYSKKGRYLINSADGLEVINIEKLKKGSDLVLTPENPIFKTETFSPQEAEELIEFVGLVVERIVKN